MLATICHKDMKNFAIIIMSNKKGGLNPPYQSLSNSSTHFTSVDFGSAMGQES